MDVPEKMSVHTKIPYRGLECDTDTEEKEATAAVMGVANANLGKLPCVKNNTCSVR